MSHVIYPQTNLTATEQLVIERGEGAYVYDNQGKRYLEGMAGLWCTSLGYGHKELMATVQEHLAKLSYSHMFGGKSHPEAIALADTLSDMVPMDNAKIFFGNSGSDANDTHIKMLRYYFNAIGKPEKRKIITRQRAYHGVTVAAGALTSLPVNLQFFDAPEEALGILRTDHPHYYSGRQGDETEAQFVDRITANLEAMIVREGPETIAAFIAEPVTGASGVIVPPAGYYEKVQAILNKYDILFWADEVITGFGRLGEDFGCNAMGIDKPDMMSFAKQLSSAYYPISASAIRGDMYDAIVEQSKKAGAFGHGYTYSGHPVACATASKVLEIYQRDRLFDHAAKLGDYLQTKLQAFADHPLVGEVRGKGMVGAVELVANKTTGESFADARVGAYAIGRCQEHGLILRNVAGNSLAVCPPLIIDESHVDEIVDIMAKVLDETLAFANGEQLIKA